MEDLPTARILLLTQTPQIARHWAEILGNPQTRLWLSLAEVPEQATIDLIFTDRQVVNLPHISATQAATGQSEASRAADEGAGLSCASHSDAGRPAVIAIGVEGPADLHLPADATVRELQLACRLMLRIVELRRALRSRADQQQRLVEAALTDPLTGLPNRRAWDQTLAAVLAHPLVGQAASLPSGQEAMPMSAGWQPAPRREPWPRVCVAILDLDHFKQVNDACGHTVGDHVLRAAAAALLANVRQGDFVARLGGDEFGLLLPLGDQPTIAAVVDRVRKAIPLALARANLPAVTASAGVCPADRHGEPPSATEPDALLAAADAALRKAKQEGRDRVSTAPPATAR